MKSIKIIVKNKYFKYFLVTAWMVVIFMLSNDIAAASSDKSNFILQILSNLGINLKHIFKNYDEFIVRKTAHFTEYFVLSILIINVIKQDFKFKDAVILAIKFTFLYACTDEFHQLFIPGRDGRIIDVFIDTSGGVFGAVVMWIFKSLRNK